MMGATHQFNTFSTRGKKFFPSRALEENRFRQVSDLERKFFFKLFFQVAGLLDCFLRVAMFTCAVKHSASG